MTISRFSRAIVLAAEAHDGQMDKQGEPYIFHPLRVAHAVSRHGNLLLPTIGVLHDVVEDTQVSLVHIQNHFGDYVAEAVDALTRRQGESYRKFIQRVKKNDLALIVKIADVSDHLSRIDGLSEADRKRLVPRYTKTLVELSARIK